MAPQATQPKTFAAEQDAADAKVHQVFLAFALGIGGLVILGATAYICYYVVGRFRKAEVATAAEDMRQPLRSLVLPGIVKDGTKLKGPKRLILSPDYPLPVYTNFEWVEDAEDSTRRRSWFKAVRHSRGLSASGPVLTTALQESHLILPTALQGSPTKQPDARPFSQSPPDKDLADFTIGDASFMANAATSYDTGSSEVHSTSFEKSSPVALSPEVVVNDFALPPPYALNARADSPCLNLSAADEKIFGPRLEVLTVPHEISFFVEKDSEPMKLDVKANRRKSSFSKLVSTLGDLSNVSRRFSKIDQDSTKTPRKNRPLASSTPRSKENARRSP